MHRRFFVGLAAALLLLGAVFSPGGRAFASSGGEKAGCIQDNPKTGDRLNPTFGGMALAFSGVALCVLADERGRRK